MSSELCKWWKTFRKMLKALAEDPNILTFVISLEDLQQAGV